MKTYSQILRNEDGGILALAAVTLTSMLAITAFAIDLGQVYVAKQRAQNVCDAAANAGAWELAANLSNPSTAQTNATSKANQAAIDNNSVANKWQISKVSDNSYGVDVTFPSGTINNDAGQPVTVQSGRAITAKGYVKVNYAFAGLLGLNSSNIQAKATTVISSETTTTGTLLAPLAASNTTIFGDGAGWPGVKFGQQVTLKTNRWQSDFIGAGNFGAVILPGQGNGASAFRDGLAGNYTTPITLITDPPTWIDTKPGNMVGPTRQGLNDRLGKETDPRFTNDATAWNNWLAAYNSTTEMFPFTWRIMIVPVVQDPVSPGNGKSQAEVVGLAGFFIESADNKGTVVGRFLQGIKSGDTIRWIFPNNDTPTTTENILEIRTIS